MHFLRRNGIHSPKMYVFEIDNCNLKTLNGNAIKSVYDYQTFVYKLVPLTIQTENLPTKRGSDPDMNTHFLCTPDHNPGQMIFMYNKWKEKIQKSKFLDSGI